MNPPPSSLRLPSGSASSSCMAITLPLSLLFGRVSSQTALCNILFYLDATAGCATLTAHTPPCPASPPNRPSANFHLPALSPKASPPSSTTTDKPPTSTTSSSPAYTQFHFRPRRPSSRSTWSALRVFQLPPATTWSTCFRAKVLPPKPKSSSPMVTKQSRSRDLLTLSPATFLGLHPPPSYKFRHQFCRTSPPNHCPLHPAPSTSTRYTTTFPWPTTVYLRLDPLPHPKNPAPSFWNVWTMTNEQASSNSGTGCPSTYATSRSTFTALAGLHRSSTISATSSASSPTSSPLPRLILARAP